MKIPVKFQYNSIVFRKNLINFTLDSGCRKAIRVGVNKNQISGKGDNTEYIIGVE